jgi:Phosphoenolpyruvate phosphomutase
VFRMTFRDLHHAELPLLLPNAWDVGSALGFVEAGFPAIGTTSFGVAAAQGSPDGGHGSGGGAGLAAAVPGDAGAPDPVSGLSLTVAHQRECGPPGLGSAGVVATRPVQAAFEPESPIR